MASNKRKAGKKLRDLKIQPKNAEKVRGGLTNDPTTLSKGPSIGKAAG